MSKELDTIFAKSRAVTEGFQFDEQVVRVFPDMISRSVPGYEIVVPMIGLLARRYAQNGSRIYDLGCSLGAASLAMSQAVRSKGTKIIAVDNSPAMIESCKEIVSDNPGRIPVDVILQDVRDTRLEDASVVVLNFTLQFLDVRDRDALIQDIANAMRHGGVLLVSEKIRFENEREQSDQTGWHQEFKRTQGYSELEIAQKRTALEKVLCPETEQAHLQRFRAAGLCRPTRWFQCFSFASYIAFRE